MFRKNLIILISSLLLLGLSACSTFSRSTKSGYSNQYEMEQNATDNFYEHRRQYELEGAGAELGIDSTRPLSEVERKLVSQRAQLKRLESQLGSSAAKRQYYNYKPYMLNDQERIDFLNIPSLQSRERWAAAKGISTRKEQESSAFSKVIEEGDITIGMTKDDVVASWGDPDLVEVSGNQLYGNERWRYKKTVSSPEGYREESRIIYFEASRVAGWESF
jgi:hypothetical protein